MNLTYCSRVSTPAGDALYLAWRLPVGHIQTDLTGPAGGAHNLVSILARPSRQMQQAAVHALASLAHRFAEPVAQVMLEQSGDGCMLRVHCVP